MTCVSGVAVFDITKFLTRYPEFSQVDAGKLNAYFEEAGLYLSNCPTSIVQNVSRRLMLLNMLVAHISFLEGDLDATNIQPAPASAQIEVTSPVAGSFVITHGLGVVPESIDILMTSAGAIWQTAAADATNLFLAASDVGLTATVSVFQTTTVATGIGSPRPVGRTSSASEGSVSASFDYISPTPGSGPWFNQTPYGAAFWQATASLRGMHYRPGPNPGLPMRAPGYFRGRFIN